MGEYSLVVHDIDGNITKITNIEGETIAIGDTAEYTFMYSFTGLGGRSMTKKTTGTVKRIRFDQEAQSYIIEVAGKSGSILLQSYARLDKKFGIKIINRSYEVELI